MVNITVEDIQQISDENLEALCDMLIRESNRRDREKRTQIIENFHAAFNAMKAAKIRVMYYPDDDTDDYTPITEWEGFSFD